MVMVPSFYGVEPMGREKNAEQFVLIIREKRR